ncbi:MAG: hypothetical protein Q7R70_05180 [Candidatus Diapherotrites archaeon]|nr:hypothetical protein [Candidatus Diapherotrites archaeon]
MEKKDFLVALQKVRDSNKQRKFKQSVELAVNFRGIDFKKSENRIDVTVSLPYSSGKASGKICVFAKDANFIAIIKDKVARVITENEITQMDKKEAGKLAEEFDGFVAEGPVMLTVGKYLGQALAPKGKMPRPIQPELSALESALRTIKSGVKVTNKKGRYLPVVHVLLGKEDSKDEELAENALAVYQTLVAKLPDGDLNVKSMFLKMTMTPAVKVEWVRK